MTQRRSEGEAADRPAEKLASLHAATRRMMRADSRESVADIAATAATDVLGFPLNTVRLYDSSTDRLLPTAVSPGVEDIAGNRRAYERGETIQWEAFDREELLTFQDITTIDDDVPRTGEGSMIVAPLDDHGVLTLGTTRSDDIDRPDEELARVLAANVEAAMDRAEVRATLAERTERLERQNERLDRFAAIVSHDLRNPLNVAEGYVELARETDDVATLDEALDALDRMDDLIDSVLTIAREGRVVDDPESVDLSAVAAQAWSTVDAAEATCSVAEDATVEADRERLRTLLENCFRNAVQHAGDDVTVTVEPLADGGFAVSDDGPGIPPEDRDAVFDRGYTTADDGTGFGLAIVRDIADAHGWTAAVAESDAGGARFEFSPDE
ncbi:HAMP domain-containing histidine kinase [Halobaculum sp. CBA1158]|uniref:sensor histidine kinase n=1 Tax=Halobaculum sp. CBA1158 TaxID=2904243 RepID=UPI001F3774D8|nr:HAMP domain-containing sensor histidine kinase [Halobaculum sp. CBA1158]UIO98435.1 HAMP domain-containing histidine kinase [Halobaculum sp. CBA1158]